MTMANENNCNVTLTGVGGYETPIGGVHPANPLINTNAESASATFFRSGWRPAMGWICVAAIAYQFLVRAILPWALTVGGVQQVPPMAELDMGSLLTILGGTIGLGGLRTFEKVKGLA